MQNIIGTLAFLMAAFPFQQPNNPGGSSLPTAFYIKIGGFHGPSYSVELRDGKLHYTADEPARQKKIEKAVTPTEEQWRQFWQKMDQVRLWQWSREYVNREVLDGTQWNVRIKYDGKSLVASGSNAYPLETDVAQSNNSPEASLPFNQFLQAVSKLIGNLPFQ